MSHYVLAPGMRPSISRRELLLAGVRVATATALGGVLAACQSPAPSHLAAPSTPLRGSPSPTSPPGTAGFVDLSRMLTGAAELPVALAPAYLMGLESSGLRLPPSQLVKQTGFGTPSAPADLAALERSAPFADKAARDCADAIAAAWWSGMVPIPKGGQRVVTYLDALVFRAMPWAQPQTECLGKTGAWAVPGHLA